MPALTTILAAAAIAASAGTAVYQGVEAKNARDDAEKQAQDQNAKQDKLLQDQKTQQEQSDQQAGAAAYRARQQRQYGGSSNSTILTGGQGVANSAPSVTPGKTLLGM